MRILRQLWNPNGLDAAVEDVPEDRFARVLGLMLEDWVK